MQNWQWKDLHCHVQVHWGYWHNEGSIWSVLHKSVDHLVDYLCSYKFGWTTRRRNQSSKIDLRDDWMCHLKYSWAYQGPLPDGFLHLLSIISIGNLEPSWPTFEVRIIWRALWQLLLLFERLWCIRKQLLLGWVFLLKRFQVPIGHRTTHQHQ